MKLFLSVLLFIGVTSTYAQNSLTGTITDASTNEPIIGANIHVPKMEKGAMTNLEGEFSLDNLPEGTLKLVISSMGYATETYTVTIPEREYINISLTPSFIEIEEVIVSTPFHQLQSENVMKVERATVEELNRTGALSFSEGITSIAGVESISTGTGIGKPVIRGLSSNRVLVYTQGVRLENQQFGDEHGLGVNSSGIESVEVIKGPASLLYGSDALGGVLYLNPERYAPEDSTGVDAKTTFYSNTLGVEANAGFKTSFEKWRFLLRGNYATHSDYETGAGDRVTNTRFNELDLKTGVGYRTDSYKGDLRYTLNNSRTGIPEEIGIQSTSKEVVEPYQDVQNHILSMDNSFFMGDSSLDVKLGYLFNNRKEFEDEHEEPDGHNENEEEEEGHEEAALEMHLETINYDVKYHLPKHGNFETIVGVQGMFQTNKNLGEEVLIPDAKTRDFGILATTHYHLEKIDFQGGLRYDNRKINSESAGDEPEGIMPAIDRSFNSYNGSFGVKFDLTEGITSRINLSTGFRAPNLAELTSNGSHHGTNRYEVGDPGLENEQNYQLDLSLEYASDHFEFFLNGFYNNINDYIFLNPTGEFIDQNAVFNYVQNDAELYGGEAGIHIHPHPLDFLHFESSYELVIGKQENGEYLPLIPAQSVLNTIRLEFPKNHWLHHGFSFVSLKTTFEQDRTSAFETMTNGYSLLSAGLGGTMPLNGVAVQLQVSGKNLLNKIYISHLSRLKPDWIPNMGRNITVSMKVIL